MVDRDTELGWQIRSLREACGMQSKALADQVGLDPATMSRIERGERAVKANELTRLAAALSVSPLALLDPGSLLARLPLAFRRSDVTAQSYAYDRIVALAEIHEALEDGGISSDPTDLRVPDSPAASWLKQVESLAAWTLDQLGSPEASDVGAGRFEWLATTIENAFGIDVLVESFDGDRLVGAALADPALPLIFVNAAQPQQRALFTLAHELGHMLRGDGEAAQFDYSSLDSSTDAERAANAFAASLLMPQSEIDRIIAEHGRKARALAEMIVQLGVSFQSLTYRLHNLRIIDATGRDALRDLGFSGLLSSLPDDGIKSSLLELQARRPELRRPKRLTGRAFRGWLNGVISVRPVAGLCRVDADELLDVLHSIENPQAASRGFDEAEYQPPSPQTTDEELFAGSPV